jgi:hypothetical protein
MAKIMADIPQQKRAIPTRDMNKFAVIIRFSDLSRLLNNILSRVSD